MIRLGLGKLSLYTFTLLHYFTCVNKAYPVSQYPVHGSLDMNLILRVWVWNLGCILLNVLDSIGDLGVSKTCGSFSTS